MGEERRLLMIGLQVWMDECELPLWVIADEPAC